MKLPLKVRPSSFARRNRAQSPVRGLMLRPLREVTFRSYPMRLEDLHLAPHGILDTVGYSIRPVRQEGAKQIGPNPRRERHVTRPRGPSHRQREF